MDVEEGSFSEKMADNILGMTLLAMDRYQSAFMRIAFGDVDPKTALEAPH